MIGAIFPMKKAPSTETHNGKTCYKTAFVREPANQRGDGCNVAKTIAQCANDAKSKIKKSNASNLISITSYQGTDAEEDTADRSHETRTFFINQRAAESSSQSKNAHKNHEGVLNGFAIPAVHFHQRIFKNRPRVNGAETQLNDYSSRGDPPCAATMGFTKTDQA